MLLSRVDVVFLFGHYFRYFPVYKPPLLYFILNTILLIAIFCTPPRRPTFSGLFNMRFYWLLFG